MKAAHDDGKTVGAEPPGEVEGPRILVRLHADQADHAGAGGADALGDAGDIDDRVALVADLDFDVDVRSEHVVLRALHDQSVNARQTVRGNQRTQPLDDVTVAVVMRRLDQSDVKCACRRGLVRQAPVQRTPLRNGTTTPSGLAAASRDSAALPAVLQQLPWVPNPARRQRGECFAPEATKLSKISGKGRPVVRAYLARSWRPSASFTSANRSLSSLIPANALSSLAAWGWDVISVNGSWPH